MARKMTKREAAIISAYTGCLIGHFGDMADYVAEKFGRPLYTVEMADMHFEIREAAREDFKAIIVE